MQVIFQSRATENYSNHILFYTDDTLLLDIFADNQRGILKNILDKKKTTHTFFEEGRVLLVHIAPDKLDAATCYQRAKKAAADFDVHETDWTVYFAKVFNEDIQAASLLGLGAGCYKLGYYKKEPKTYPTIRLSIPENLSIQPLQATLETQFEIMELVNGPGNKVHAQALKAWAEASASKYEYSVEFFDNDRLESLGFGALLAIGAGSPEHNGMLLLKYKHADAPADPVALIGKGVTFDTGGYSIKGANNMHYMKCDMGGGAAVLGAVELIAKLKLPVNVVGLVPMAQNSISGQASLPGDVVKAYSGHSIEIIDTDAEGRLLLADATGYAVANLNPSAVINVATLTGSSVRTFGYNCAALFSNNESLQKLIMDCGQRIGERSWPLPVWEEYHQAIQSDIADIKNLGGPVAGAIIAAKFIQFFTNKHPNWAHLDIAGVAFGNNAFSKDKSATGYGVLLLKEVVEAWTKQV